MLKVGRRVGAAALLAISALSLMSTQAQAQLGLGSLIVAMTSPASGSIVSDTVPVRANGSVIGLITVRGVQFQLDGANLGAEDTSAPYSVSWHTTTTGNGSHTVTAVARDLLGVQYPSAPVTVTVANSAPPPPADTTPPTVSITSPANGETISGTVPVRASASDNVGVMGVQFFRDGTALGAEDTTAPYSVSWNTTTVSDGSHTLTAVARDAAGNRSPVSAPVTVTVSNAPPPPPPDTTPPTGSITSPSSGQTVLGTVSVTASASDDVGVAGVQFLLDGTNLGAESTTAPYSTSWNTTAAANGSHTLTAVARHAAGNRSDPSAPVTVTVANGAPPPPPPPPPGATTRFEETDPSVTYAPAWTEDGTRSWSGGTPAGSAPPGAPVTITLPRAPVSWIGGGPPPPRPRRPLPGGALPSPAGARSNHPETT